MSAKRKKRYSAHFKFQVVMEAIKGEKSVGQLARSYNVHPISILLWKKEFMERGPEIFSQKTTIRDYERRIRELERLIGHKEVEIALLKNFLTESSVGMKSSV